MRLRPALLAALVAVALGGCATAGPSSPDERAVPRDAGSSAGGGTPPAGLHVVATYAAASGRTCRRLADDRGVVQTRVSCLQPGGEWRLGRALGGFRPEGLTASAAPAAPAAAASPPLVPAAVLGGDPVAASAGRAGDDLVGRTLRRDETLWSFAARVTGDPLDWRRIARLNGIEDAADVDSGRSLLVPASIVR